MIEWDMLSDYEYNINTLIYRKGVRKQACMPVIKPLCALIIPVLTIPGCIALIVTLAFLSCIFDDKNN